MWAPIDRGHLGACVKTLGKAKFAAWMENPSEADPAVSNWENWDSEKVSMREKRILSTWVFGEAWEEIQKDVYKDFRYKAWSYSGLACTMSGVNDDAAIGEGFLEPFGMVDVDEPFLDEAYVKNHYSGHPDFGQAEPVVAPGTPDEQGENSPSPADTEMDTNSSSDSD